MKITIESEYEIQSVEFKNFDVDLDQIVKMFRGMLRGLEYPEIEHNLRTSEEIDCESENRDAAKRGSGGSE